jgi:hypothetical protein
MTEEYEAAVAAIDAAMAALSSEDQLHLLAMASGFALSMVGAGERAQARDAMVELIDATSRHAVLARCDG